MRLCSNPRCKKPIEGCFGTTKAGDLLEFYQGKRKGEAIRQLCPFCATRAIMIMGKEPSPKRALRIFSIIGWGPTQPAHLPAP